MAPAASIPDGTIRLRLDPCPSNSSTLRGGWWPRSGDTFSELSALVAALLQIRDDVSYVLANVSEWAPPHPQLITARGRTVRIGWHRSQSEGLITVISRSGQHRFDLLVVPPYASEPAAEAALNAAADPADNRPAPDLLTEIRRRCPGRPVGEAAVTRRSISAGRRHPASYTSRRRR